MISRKATLYIELVFIMVLFFRRFMINYLIEDTQRLVVISGCSFQIGFLGK